MIRSDMKAYGIGIVSLVKGALTGHSFFSVLLYRQGNWLYKKKIKLLPDILRYISLRNFGCEISPYATIGEGFKVLHSPGIVIGHQVIIGQNCELYQNVTIGSNRKPINGREMPIIGDNVTICSGAVILGAIVVGDNVIIGANSVVTHNVPSNSVVAGSPAKVIKTLNAYKEERK